MTGSGDGPEDGRNSVADDDAARSTETETGTGREATDDGGGHRSADDDDPDTNATPATSSPANTTATADTTTTATPDHARMGRPPSTDPTRDAPDPEQQTEAVDGNPITWVLRTDHSYVVAAREVLSSVLMVALIGAVLFALSGIWPPLVAVESGSMEPHMFKGDLVFLVENGRFAPRDTHAGVVTYRQANPSLADSGADEPFQGYWSFGSHGNVIVYQPNGRGGTPIIHRAHIYVEQGENWYDEANPDYLGGATNCEELRNCPAPHDGFITKGDNNPTYDQVGPVARSSVVKPEWVRGVAKVRVPWLGCIRLQLSGTPCL